MVLGVEAPVYRRLNNGERRFISDAERESEGARVDGIVERDCSTDATAR